MIALFIQCYLNILLTIGVSSICVFFLGLYFIFKFIASREKSGIHIVPEDFSAIAGDDILVTQLDLARAYIETDKKLLAKQILEAVIAQGTVIQKNEAQRLLNII
jgi:FimV-like protein